MIPIKINQRLPISWSCVLVCVRDTPGPGATGGEGAGRGRRGARGPVGATGGLAGELQDRARCVYWAVSVSFNSFCGYCWCFHCLLEFCSLNEWTRYMYCCKGLSVVERTCGNDDDGVREQLSIMTINYTVWNIWNEFDIHDDVYFGYIIDNF